MTEQESPPDNRPTAVVKFLGRMVEVTMPKPEQILVWRRTLHRLQAANPESWTGAEVLAALERTRKIIDTLLANLADVEWLDDEMLAGRASLKDCAGLITEAIEAFQAEPANREERRAAKKPARRVAAKKAAGKRVQK
jgi:hypothetical protein